MAGYTYQQNLLKAIRLADPKTEIFLVRKPHENVASLPARGLADMADRVLECPAPRVRRWSRQWVEEQIYRRALRRARPDRALDDLLAVNNVDAVFGSWWQYPEVSEFPSLGLCVWIHDFQFVHFPQFYDAEILKATRRDILRSVDAADRVIVSSRDALRDLQSFSAAASGKTRVMPFVADIPEEAYTGDPGLVVRQYHLPEKFIYLPNQFWQHKNHGVVLESLHMLAGRGVRPNIVCTGLPHDSRVDTYFAGLLKQVAERGLHGQLIFLGLVPIEHVRLLMRQAICVLNPSLFEGWSSTVEEARSLGKGLVLSDLTVHREQNPPGSRFFDARSPEGLATELETVWQESNPGPDPGLEAVARKSLEGRLREFGQVFLEIAREAADSRA